MLSLVKSRGMVSGYLVRQRLVQALQQALASGHVLIEAPAGYGKTVLLRHLSARRPDTYYFKLTPAHVDLALLRAQLQPRLTRGTTILLDDVHLLADGAETRDWLTSQMQNEEPRWVLVGRQVIAPSVPVAATRVTAEHLAFSPDESRVLLGTDRIPPQVALWHEQLAGWPMGMDLLARLPTLATPLPALQEQLFPYLAKAVIAPLPAELRLFLQISAVPLRVNDELVAFLLDAYAPSLVPNAALLRQDVQRRNLFLYPEDEAGWFRYHDLFRAFLLDSGGLELSTLFEHVVAWFEKQSDIEMMLEHALAGGLQEEAAGLLLSRAAAELVWNGNRYASYRRWVLALDEGVRARFPKVLLMLGTFLHYSDIGRDEAWQHLHKGLSLAEQQGDRDLQRNARVRMASLYFNEGRLEEAWIQCHRLLEDPECGLLDRLYAYRIGAVALARMARFQEARRLFEPAIDLAEANDQLQEAAFNRTNYSMTILTPLGRFVEGQEQILAAEPHIGGPALRVQTFQDWCELFLNQGNWTAMTSKLQAMEAGIADLETKEPSQDIWYGLYSAARATGLGELASAQEALDAVRALAEEAGTSFAQRSLEWLEVWLHRRQDKPLVAARLAETFLQGKPTAPLRRAQMALERDIALGTAFVRHALEWQALHPETRHLIRWRARAELVRLRALLAVVCWHRGDPRWRRHIHAACFATHHYPLYARLLTTRDPDLGALFWKLALVEGVFVEEARAALAEIGRVEPVLPLLTHKSPEVVRRAAAVVAEIGDERAMPELAEALHASRSSQTTRVLKATRERLEQSPPPSLRVRVMGEFALWRDEVRVPEEAWSRPVVRRLFQFFALHRGRPLSRERILEEMWPTTPEANAGRSFRTVYSHLRRVLEPYMRAQGPCRYMEVTEHTYRFDPHSVVEVDALSWIETVRATLDGAHMHDVPPLPTSFLNALDMWQPLLPTLQYEEWVLPIRERMHDTFVDGCLHAARAWLHRGEPAAAQQWSQRAIQQAPWLEEAYQTRMRAWAQQGQRARALRTYEEAVEALKRELGVEPSPLTRWLYEQLQRGEPI
jgi:ATP/maltotriose-dependent transcriptional regulator MalT/DNA-binding SARP family transcriptional activator